MPRYSKYGKIARPITEEEFKEGIEAGHFCQLSHKAYCVLLWYSAVRKTEGLRALREQFIITKKAVYFEVGPRLKKQKAWIKKTEPLKLLLRAPFMDILKAQIEKTKPGKKVFPFSSRTAYNAVARVFKYPHLFRLTRITWFYKKGYTTAQIRSWTALSLRALEFYLGLVEIDKMAEALAG